MSQKYQIGDTVWWATWDASTSGVICPDCGGTGRLRVTFHDETTVSINCQNCAVGYDPPTGRIKVYDRQAKAQPTVITGYEVGPEETRYRTTDSYLIEESRLFDTKEEALKCAKGMVAEVDAEERAKILRKEKDTRSWAWNASYHRNNIKRAQRDIEYHTEKLNVAAIRAKEK